MQSSDTTISPPNSTLPDQYQSDYASFLFMAKAQNIARHKNVNLISEIGVTLSTVFVFWNWFNNINLMVWAVVTMLVSCYSWYARADFHPYSADFNRSAWLNRAVFTSFIVAFCWGLVPVLFFAPEMSNYLIFVVCVYAGYVAGALSVTFANTPSFLAFIIGISAPFVARMFYEGEMRFNILGIQVLFFAGLQIYVSRNIHDLFLASTQSNYQSLLLTQQLANEKSVAEEAVMAKNKFLASASHDLRQPLNAIGLFNDALKNIDQKVLRDEILGKISLSLKALNGMLHSLLDISKLDASAVDNEPESFSLEPLVEQIADEYRTKSPHLYIETKIDEKCSVFVDQTILLRVVRNIIDNACKYTPSGSVFVEAETMRSSVNLAIRDTGIGIPEDKIAHVFDEFEQLNNPERNREKGLGLGLAIVKRLCKISNIELDLKSDYGKGTTVTLAIPKGEEISKTASKQTHDVALDGRLIVVIDDEVDILDGMQHLIKGWGCTSLLARSGQEAIAALHKLGKTPDIIISDLRLQAGEQGDEAIELIREEYNQDFPALLITGDTAPERINHAKASGLTVMYKPIETDTLKQTIYKLISQQKV